MPPPLLSPSAERLSALLRLMSEAVAKRTGWALTLTLIALIAARLRTVRWRFERLAARIGAGTYAPRIPSAASSGKPAERPRRPPPKDPLPRTVGWLRPLIAPESVAFSGMLDSLLRDPEMVALMQAAPAAMGRVLRPLCRMLGVTPPPAVALPPRRMPAPRPRREPPPPDPYPKTRLGFHKGLPDLPPYTGRFAALPPRKSS